MDHELNTLRTLYPTIEKQYSNLISTKYIAPGFDLILHVSIRGRPELSTFFIYDIMSHKWEGGGLKNCKISLCYIMLLSRATSLRAPISVA